MTDHLTTIEEHLTDLHEVLSAGGTNKNDLIQYAKTKIACMLAYIDNCYPDEPLAELHLDENDCEHCEEGYV
jgi:hypothetical protein